ncbi:hypothetical protein VSS74_15875 [Conexibacter stalactiti]|uniref:Uncharacterized protein n=1 Tax=Conexibacter stalactiti TaxID=1940611 RepID=A0ABU4HRB4_9ACTN|nr:hypothetical protein [Conexibacter stalactiti]MDW5595827.1 hypothetical protein [Conexibacter stalactiti]MEC5036469.1 hypothetical protein [Conexibacter stalactiti]
MSETDDLMVRLRAADPAAAQAGDRAAQPSDEQQGRRDRDSVTAARRRRQARRHARTGVGGGLAAFLGALAIGLSGGGGGGPVTAALPGVERVIAQAAHASDLPDGKILQVTSDVSHISYSDGRLYGVVEQRRTQWIRLDRRGRVLEFRSRITKTNGDYPPPIDTASYRADGDWWTDEWAARNPRSPEWELTRRRSRMVADSMSLRAAQILRRAQAGRGRHVALVGEAEVDGRRAYLLRVDSIDQPPHHGYKQLFVDAATYAPLKQTQHSWGDSDVDGVPYESFFEERILKRQVLADTEENRARLKVRGPTG